MMSLLRPMCLRSVLRGAGELLRRSMRSKQFVNFDDDKFQANVDVHDYNPEEIRVDVEDSTVTVEGRHEERVEGQRFTTRQFVKKYVLPKGYYDVKKVESSLSSDGVLTITAPRVDSPEEVDNRSVPIVETGQPFKR